MSEAELIAIVRDGHVQIAALYGQLISINFALFVATYYFLNRSGLALKLPAFAMYLVGMLMYFGLMLEESNVARQALLALRELPGPSRMAAAFLALHDGWLFKTTSVFLNVGFWTLALANAFLLFAWRKPEPR